MPRLSATIICLLIAGCSSGDSGSSGAGGPLGGGSGDDEFDALMAAAAADIDAFWTERLSEVSTEPYVAPSDVKAYAPGTLPSGAGCGLADEDPADWVNNAFHCSEDHLIAYDEAFLQRLQSDFGDLAPIAILAHEWGHHVQYLAGRPGITMQRELQADCYAGIYIAHADEAGTFGGGDIRDAVVTFFNQGDRDYRADTWFDKDVHGPPHERALATGTGILTEDPRYCVNYGTYAPRDPLTLGTYTLYLPAALTPEATDNNLTRLVGPEATAYIAHRSDIGTGDASELLPAIAQAWFGTGWIPLEDPHDAGVSSVFGGTDALQAYEWTFTDQAGVTRQQHGALLLLASGSGDGLIIDVARVGPAPELTGENMEAIGDFLYLLAWGVCPPSGEAWACAVEP